MVTQSENWQISNTECKLHNEPSLLQVCSATSTPKLRYFMGCFPLVWSSFWIHVNETKSQLDGFLQDADVRDFTGVSRIIFHYVVKSVLARFCLVIKCDMYNILQCTCHLIHFKNQLRFCSVRIIINAKITKCNTASNVCLFWRPSGQLQWRLQLN